ncbi:MAG TPA: flagellar export chaperone FlgN [Myxococcales bacterium]|nr:flagellar export chaperone FlgN [Myxococcales bacterium]
MTMKLEDALAQARTIKVLLEAELERTEAERAALRSVDAQTILGHATTRELFSSRARAEVADFQAKAAAALGLPAGRALTRDAVRAVAMKEPLARPLHAAMMELASLARALDQRYRRNQTLAERALACVRGYLSALAPRPVAYTRRGSVPSLSNL